MNKLDNKEHKKSIILIPLGEPRSVNSECVATLYKSYPQPAKPIVLIGDRALFDEQIQLLNKKIVVKNIELNRVSEIDESAWYFLDINVGFGSKTLNLNTFQRGLVAALALETSKKLLVILGPITAVLTCPISKKNTAEAGFKFDGQTEFFASIYQSSSIMLLNAPKITVGLVTNHVALKDVAQKISQELVEEKLKLLFYFLRDTLNISAPRIGVCGLNPHASDGGLFGNEERDIIAPAILNSKPMTQNCVEGPLAADTLFYQAVQQNKFDGVLAMYHDQGLSPLKAMFFEETVNITAGLPFLRVSPDHGPAEDLYLKNMAQTKSFERAFDLCLKWKVDK